MTLYADIDAHRDAAPQAPTIEHVLHRAQERAVARRDAAEAEETLERVLAHVSRHISPAQVDHARRCIARHDYRALGKLLCDAHEQLVAANLAGTAPRHVVLWDEMGAH
jgi:CBS-domain-containing membrane protein